MVYKSLHGLAPNYLSSKFERRETAYNLRNLRINQLFHCCAQTIIKIALAIVAPFFGGTVLREDLREAESLWQFKRLLK